MTWRSIKVGLTLFAALLAVAGAPGAAAAEPRGESSARPELLLGYNDNFNVYELHERNDLEDIIAPVGSSPVPLPGDRRELHAAGERLIKRAKEGGAKVVRYVVPWMRVERNRGSYDFSVDDETYRMVLEAGLRPLIVITTSPCWAHPSIPCENGFNSVRPDSQFLDHFARFTRATVNRYPQAAAFEIWNESNFVDFWGAPTNPRSYRKMLVAVDARISGAHPPLLYNGLIPNRGWRKYFRRSFVKLGAGDLVDGVAIHPYSGSDGANVVRRRIKGAKKFLRKARVPRRMWITEVGWSTAPGAERAVQKQTQARRVRRLETIATDLRMRSLIIHRLQDIDHEDPWEAGLGALEKHGAPKPLFCDLSLRHASLTPQGC